MQTISQYKIQDFNLFPLEYALQKEGGEKVNLQPKFIEVLVYLAEQYPRIVPRQELIDNVWKGNHYVGEKALTNAIWHLRKNLEGNGSPQAYIETIRKTGYRLLVQPEVIATETKPAKPILEDYSSAKVDSLSLMKRFRLPIVAVLMAIFGAVGWHYLSSYWPSDQPQIETITTEPGRELFVAPSPDGRFIVYKWMSGDGQVDLYLRDLQQPDVAAKPLTADEWSEGLSVWSNDGEYLYYSSKSEKFCDIIRLKISTNQKQKISECPVASGYNYIDISPDDKILAYQSDHDKDMQSGIYFLDLSVGESKPIRFSCKHECAYEDRDFAFSPDGKRAAVTRRTHQFSENIYLVDIQQGTAKQLTEGHEDIVGITWHPDGRRLVFGVQKADTRSGYLIDTQTLEQKRLPMDGFSFPAFAKQSGELYYQQRQERYQISSLDLEQSIASSPFPILLSDYSHRNPDYSPVRQKIAYVSNVSGNYELWLSNKSGQDRKQLTKLGLKVRYPRWSHDGNKIAFLAPIEDEVGDRIYIIDVNSGQLSFLKAPYLLHNRPSWSFDDSAIISAIYDNEFTDLYKIDIQTGDARRLTNDGGRFGVMVDK
ncbi:MAG: winged helix-turn-helix domain-containing protein, partial [Kangiellaceae bacterium]|nr:winged helix-turn-helix domain-containing protein [Kangiellaceae bacterium]